MGIWHHGDVIVVINSDIVQEVIVISCFPLPFRFWGSLVLVVEPRSLGARGAILPSVLFIVTALHLAMSTESRMVRECSRRDAKMVMCGIPLFSGDSEINHEQVAVVSGKPWACFNLRCKH